MTKLTKREKELLLNGLDLLESMISMHIKNTSTQKLIKKVRSKLEGDKKWEE